MEVSVSNEFGMLDCPTPVTIRNPFLTGAKHPIIKRLYPDAPPFIQVPCGHCLACRSKNRNDWTLRLVHEYECHSPNSSSFVTLTYREYHLTFDEGIATLNHRDVQLFLKRLRKMGYTFRYFGVGEYCPSSGRPHYHILFFWTGPFGRPSDIELYQAWHAGFITQSPYSIRRVRYVAKYALQLATSLPGREPVYNFMSRNPGIGYSYLDQNRDALSRKKSFKIDKVRYRVPRYYTSHLENPASRVHNALKYWSSEKYLRVTDVKYLDAQQRRYDQYKKIKEKEFEKDGIQPLYHTSR